MDTIENLHISETVELNMIVWVRSLPADELGPSERMLEDLKVLESIGGLSVEVVDVPDHQSVIALLDQLSDRAEQGLRPLLHFDCHGSTEGLALASEESLSWEELAKYLRRINEMTKNNLVCVLATCFGLRLGKTLRLSEATPWYIMIAPQGEVTVGVLQDKTRPFYETLTNTLHINAAFRQSFEPDLQIFNCQVLFVRSLIRYILDYASGNALMRRTESLLTRSLNMQSGARNRQHLRRTRRAIKSLLKPGQGLIDHYAKTFLIGRKPVVNYLQLRHMVTRQREAEQRQYIPGRPPSRSSFTSHDDGG